MSKLHFLFLMLNISQVNIIDQGQITGIITKLEFLKKRKQEERIFREERKKNRLVNIVPRAINKIGQIGSAMIRRGPTNAGAKSGHITPKKAHNQSVEHTEKLLDMNPPPSDNQNKDKEADHQPTK